MKIINDKKPQEQSAFIEIYDNLGRRLESESDGDTEEHLNEQKVIVRQLDIPEINPKLRLLRIRKSINMIKMFCN